MVRDDDPVLTDQGPELAPKHLEHRSTGTGAILRPYYICYTASLRLAIKREEALRTCPRHRGPGARESSPIVSGARPRASVSGRERARIMSDLLGFYAEF